MSEPVAALGALLREQAAECGSSVTRLGTLFVRVTRHGNEWALELSDDTRIGGNVIQEWNAAVGVPYGSKWVSAYGRKEWRCEWTGTEDTAPAGSKAFYLGGAK
jgi:hypothetical protein